MDLSACLVILAISSASCDTGSDLQISDFSKEIKLLKDEMMSLRTQLNYEKTARLELDKDLTEMTRRYRQLSVEFDDLQAQLNNQVEGERNLTEIKYNLLTENYSQLQTATENRFQELAENFQSQLETSIENGRKYTESRFKQLTYDIKNNRNYTNDRHEELLSKMKTMSTDTITQIERNLTEISKSKSKGMWNVRMKTVKR